MSIELAWAAGFFDGEGSVGRYASGRSFNKENPPTYPKVGIHNTDIELLERFRLAVGLGSIDGPMIKKVGHKPIYKYRVDGQAKVISIYLLLKPYLGAAKSRDFENALGLVSQLAEEAVSNAAK
jgi:hypothetical protein